MLGYPADVSHSQQGELEKEGGEMYCCHRYDKVTPIIKYHDRYHASIKWRNIITSDSVLGVVW